MFTTETNYYTEHTYIQNGEEQTCIGAEFRVAKCQKDKLKDTPTGQNICNGMSSRLWVVVPFLAPFLLISIVQIFNQKLHEYFKTFSHGLHF